MNIWQMLRVYGFFEYMQYMNLNINQFNLTN